MGTKTHNNYEDLITFTRASGGHALRPVSYGNELLSNSDFDGSVTGFQAVGGATIAYDATEGGAEVTVTGSGGGIADAQTVSVTAGKMYQISATLKKTTFSGQLHIQADGTNIADITPTTDYKTFVANVVATDTDLNVSIPRKSSPTGIFFVTNFSVKEVTFDESDGTLTLFEHPDNIPRVEYDADGNRLGLLIEESRTNLIANSDFDAGVSQSGVTSTANASESPDGLQNATSLDITTTGAFAYFTVSVAAGTEYTWSWFAKAGTATTHIYAVYDITNAAFVSREQYTLTSGQNYGRGWYRHSETFTAPSGCTEVRVYPVRATDNSGYVSGAIGTTFVWGGQLEADSFASSIIRTTGSSATRSADVVEISGDVFGLNDKEGTMFIEFDQTYVEGGTGFPRAVELGNNTTAVQRCNIYIAESTNRLTAALNTNNVNQTLLALDTSLTGTLPMTKVAYGFADDNVGASDNGDTALTDTAADFSSATNKRNRITFGTSTFVGHIKSFKYYPRRLTNAQLEDLSS